jgi:hypothetical protein
MSVYINAVLPKSYYITYISTSSNIGRCTGSANVVRQDEPQVHTGPPSSLVREFYWEFNVHLHWDPDIPLYLQQCAGQTSAGHKEYGQYHTMLYYIGVRKGCEIGGFAIKPILKRKKKQFPILIILKLGLFG